MAAAYGLPALAEQLIKKVSDVNAIDAEESPTPLWLAAQADFNDPGKLDLMKIVLERGAKPNVLYPDGPTPFHWAVYFNPTIQIIKLFLDHNAKLDILDGLGYNVMHYFSFTGTDPEALKFLLSAGGDINKKDKEGETPLHKLVSRSEVPLDLLRVYLEEHAEVDIEDRGSQSRSTYH